jgi:hypothetical protein
MMQDTQSSQNHHNNFILPFASTPLVDHPTVSVILLKNHHIAMTQKEIGLYQFG